MTERIANDERTGESFLIASNGYGKQDAEEIEIPVAWGIVAGKWWGPKEVQPIICVHGWQDNAGTFDNLAPLLSPEISLLAIDLPGHGRSSHLPEGQFYYLFWDNLVLLRRIVKYYKWDKVKILGHSLGGIIGFLYAASYPDEVVALMSLDIASPNIRDTMKTITMTGDQIDRFFKYEKCTVDNAPCHNYEEMINIAEAGYNGSVTRKSAEVLMRRGMKPAPIQGSYYFSRDPRLKACMLGMLSMDYVLAYASKIKCSYLNIRAVPGMKFEEPENYHKVLDVIRKSSKEFVYREIEGTHHAHLNNPEKVAPIIKKFLKV